MPPINLSPPPPPDYAERVRKQTFAWAMGLPYHDEVTDECCPDFSCCHPELLETDHEKRWEYYRNRHGS